MALVLAASIGMSFCSLAAPHAAQARLAAEQREALGRYLTALQARRYAAAFALLSDDERSYFGSASNFASAYSADRLRLTSFRIVGSRSLGPRTLAYVAERVSFFDYAHRVSVALDAKVAYVLVGSSGRPRILDRYHPWRALAPADLQATAGGVRATVRKISFFTRRLEVVVTFANFGDGTATLLPYGKSVVRDEFGKPNGPFRSKNASLTDMTLFTGLRLAANAEYTGTMSFVTRARFSPHALSFTFAPALLDGAEAPFSIALPALKLAAEG